MSKLHLTRRALLELRDIRDYSVETFGEATANTYMENLMTALRRVAQNPDCGLLRQHRTWPFLMAPVEKHFAIYKTTEDGIAVATILHGRRDIETLIEALGDRLAEEIAEIKKST